MKSKIIEWFRKLPAKTFVGKWKLIGAICQDLQLETFPYNFAGRKNYPWNVEVAKVLNELLKEKILVLGVEGRAYTITLEEHSARDSNPDTLVKYNRDNDQYQQGGRNRG